MCIRDRGAGGITEAITCIQCIRTGVVPPTLNLDELDEKCASLNYVPHKAIEKEVRVAMSKDVYKRQVLD